MPHHPWGSTLTFQLDVGVPCGTGLRHGVTMHPRGRHLRGGMTLLPHGVTQRTACEQQPTQPPLSTQLPLLGPTMQCECGKREKARIQFPRRDVSQRSSTAKSSKELGEPDGEIRPKVTKMQRRRESWLSPYGTRSNLVSPRNGIVYTQTFIGNWNSRSRLGPYNTTTTTKHNRWKPTQPLQQPILQTIGCMQ